MIQPNKSVKRRKKNAVERISPQPCWVQAFMIKMLHKLGGTETLTVADLKRFEALESDNKTLFDFNEKTGTVTITAPEMIIPDKPKIIHNQGLKFN